MSKVFLIPGLGADYRIYQNLNFGGLEVVYIKWVDPDNKDTLTTYAQKLVNEYNITPGSIVAGNSLGGMLAIEVAKLIELKQTILISSIKSIAEAPWYFPVFKHLPVYKLIPGGIIIPVCSLAKPLFGLYKLDGELFIDMLKGQSPKFIKWAMHALLNWDNRNIPANVFYLTGNKDHLFSHRRISGATIIEGGTHVMVFDRAEEINEVLKSILPNETTSRFLPE